MNPARWLIAVATAAFGLHYLLCAFPAVPRPGPPWYPGPLWLSIAAGLGLVSLASGIAISKRSAIFALTLGAALLLRSVVFHLPELLRDFHQPGPWTTFAEMAAMGAGAIALAGSLMPNRPIVSTSARWIFALSLFVFAEQHRIYADFVSGLIPRWIPWRLFWSYFTGCAFLAAGLAILTRQMAWLASYLLAGMFFIWVLILHIPLTIAKPTDGNLWTSLFVAVSMVGNSCAIAALFRGRAVRSREPIIAAVICPDPTT